MPRREPGGGYEAARVFWCSGRSGCFASVRGACRSRDSVHGPKANAQEAEPRSYSNTPVGLNFLIAGYLYTQGKIAFDPELSIADAKFHSHTGALAYVRISRCIWQVRQVRRDTSLFVFFREGSRGWPAQRSRDVGIGRPTISFFNKPVRGSGAFSERVCELQAGPHYRGEPAGFGPAGAIRRQQIAQPRQQPLVVQTRTGYFEDLGPVDRGVRSRVSFYFTDNTDFFNGRTFAQAPIYFVRGHIIYNFKSGVWVSLDGSYIAGGRTTVNGVRGITSK